MYILYGYKCKMSQLILYDNIIHFVCVCVHSCPSVGDEASGQPLRGG